MNKDDPDLQEQEEAWLRFTERGTAQVNSGQLVLAEENWQQAASIAEGFDAGDPRRAASWNNLAVVARFAQRMADAERLYRQALEEWDRAQSWIEHMEPFLCARSSVFHLRLEQKHRAQFARWTFDEYYKEQPRGVAITRNNQAEWYQRGGDHEYAAALYRTALNEYETPDAPAHGSAAIRCNLAACENRNDDANQRPAVWTAALAETFMVQARREEWVIDRPPDFTDEGRFMAGLACACLIERT